MNEQERNEQVVHLIGFNVGRILNFYRSAQKAKDDNTVVFLLDLDDECARALFNAIAGDGMAESLSENLSPHGIPTSLLLFSFDEAAEILAVNHKSAATEFRGEPFRDNYIRIVVFFDSIAALTWLSKDTPLRPSRRSNMSLN